MGWKKHGSVLLNGFIVVAPIIITVYVVAKTLWWLDKETRAGLTWLNWWDKPWPGIGIVIGIGAIYLVGLLAEIWLFDIFMNVSEHLIGRIPLVKSLYSGVRDLLQFLGGPKAASRGKAAVLRSADGKIELLGIITQEQPEKFLPGREGKVAVYLPMSYQIGGFTLFLPREAVEEVPNLSVEEVMKLTLTAGVGTAPSDQAEGPPAPDTKSKGGK